MIELNLIELEKEITNLKKTISDYENNFFLINNEYKNIQDTWQSQTAITLFEVVEKEKHDRQKLVLDMKNYLELYNLIAENYQKIGKTIKCNLEAKDKILKKIELNIEKLDHVINRYNNLGDISFYQNSNLVINEKNRLEKIRISLLKNKEYISKKYEEIKNIEQEIMENLKKLGFTKINLVTLNIER